MKSATPPNPADLALGPRRMLLDQVLFYILLALLCTRPLIGETFEPLQVSFLTALQVERGPTPAHTAWLDTLLLTAAILTLARHGHWRRGPVFAIGCLLLAAAVLISGAAAGDRPLALLAGGNLLITALAGAALASLVRTRGMRRLLLAALLATGVTTAIRCADQHWYENPLTQERWETVHKPELIRQGVDPLDPLFINFERRIRAGEAYGFLGHPNVTASCLLMWLLVALAVPLGLLRSSRPARLPALVGMALGVLLAAALWLTGSKGALVAAVGGSVVLIVLGFRATWCAAHGRTVLTLLVAGYLALIAAGVAYGLKKDTLPSASLAFRWDYWTAAWRAWQDAPLTGLGRENFAAAYTQYKRPQRPEEVRNPHNLWLSLLVEMGPLGLVAGGLLAGGCLLRALRGLQTSPANPEDRSGGILPVVVGVFLIHTLFSGTPFSEPGVLLVYIYEIVVPWLLAAVLSFWLVTRLDAIASSFWLAAGLCAALLAGLVHATVDFALLTPAGVAVFALCAVASGPPKAETLRAPTRLPVLPLLVGAALLAGQIFAVAWPATQSALALAALDKTLRMPPAPARTLALERIATDYSARHIGDDTARTLLRVLLHSASAADVPAEQSLVWLRLVRARAEAGAAANPREASNYMLLAEVDQALADDYARAYDLPEVAASRRRCAEDWDHAAELNPTNLHVRTSAGDAWLKLVGPDGAADAAARARAHYERALQIDNSRPAEEVVRLRPQERAAILEALNRLSGTTQPATGESPRY
jgi:O-antigen ligase